MKYIVMIIKMGFGEKVMTTWAYTIAGLAIAFTLLVFANSILSIVSIKGSISVNTRQSVVILNICTLVFAVVVGIIAILALLKVRKAGQLYLRVASNAVPSKTLNRSEPTFSVDRSEPTQPPSSMDDINELFS